MEKNLPRHTVEVKCMNPSCGINFKALSPVSMMPGVKFTAHFEGVGKCPLCKSPGEMMPNTFKVDEQGIMNVLNEPEYTEEVLERIKELALEAEQKEYTPEEFKKEITSLGVPDSFMNLIIPQDQAAFYDFLQVLVPIIVALIMSKTQKMEVVIVKNKKKKKNKGKKKRQETEAEYQIRKEYNKSRRS